MSLLDKIEDERGARLAHVALAYLSKLFNWHAKRNDGVPLADCPRHRAGQRQRASPRTVPSDDQLRAVWAAAEASGSLFDRYVQFLLLTAVRRTEAAGMTRAELAGTDWVIPAQRMKGKREFLLPLSQAALSVLAKSTRDREA